MKLGFEPRLAVCEQETVLPALKPKSLVMAGSGHLAAFRWVSWVSCSLQGTANAQGVWLPHCYLSAWPHLLYCFCDPPTPTLWMALTLNIGTLETEWGRFWEKQQKWFRKERGWCMWRDKKRYIYLTGLGDSWERMWTPKRAKNGLSVFGGSLQLQHQYLSLWSHAEIPQGFIECGRLCFCSQCVSRGCVLSGSGVR